MSLSIAFLKSKVLDLQTVRDSIRDYLGNLEKEKLIYLLLHTTLSSSIFI